MVLHQSLQFTIQGFEFETPETIYLKHMKTVYLAIYQTTTSIVRNNNMGFKLQTQHQGLGLLILFTLTVQPRGKMYGLFSLLAGQLLMYIKTVG